MGGPKFFNGNVYYTYSFQFKSDKSSPPSTLLDVTFKLGEEVVLGFQPKIMVAR